MTEAKLQELIKDKFKQMVTNHYIEFCANTMADFVNNKEAYTENITEHDLWIWYIESF